MTLDPIYTWQPTTCGMCGQPIVYVGPYWQHTGEAQPRHPAVPAAEWERLKVQQVTTEATPKGVVERLRWLVSTSAIGVYDADDLLIDIADLLAALDQALALLRQCRPWLPAVERELREAVARALGEE